jgi:hypothetical protein
MRHDLDELRGKVCAEYSVVAEPIRAMERAEIETKRALDVLRYSTSWLYNNNRQVAIIGLESDIVPQSRTAFTLSLSTRTYRISHRHVGPLFTLEISKQSTKEMKRKGIFKVARILEKPTDGVTDFEDTLLRGIHSCRSLKFVGASKNTIA